MFREALSFFAPEKIYTKLLKSIFWAYISATVCRVLFFIFNAKHFPEVSFSDFLYYCLAGLRFDSVSVLYMNIIFISMNIMPLKIRYNKIYQKIGYYMFLLGNVLHLVPNIGDIVYYNYIKKRTSASFFREFRYQTNWGSLVWSFFVDFWYLFVIFGVLVLLLRKAYLLSGIYTKNTKSENAFIYYGRAVLYCALSVGVFVIGVRGGIKNSTRPITMSNAGQYVKNPKDQNLVLNSAFTILKSLELGTLPDVAYFDDENELDSIYNPRVFPNKTESFVGKNVVVIVLESFGKEPTGFFNKDLNSEKYGYTPFLDSLMSKGLVFEYSYANTRQSIDVLPAIVSSLPRIHDPFVTTSYYDNRIESLPRILKDKGYRTSFFHGSNYGAMGFWGFLKPLGVDDYYSRAEYNHDQYYDGIWGVWDDKFFEFFGEKLDTFREPFFSLFFSVSSHHPYNTPDYYTSPYPEDTYKFYKTVGYTDNALKSFFQQIQSMPWYRNTLFVITGDHCQTFAQLPRYATVEGLYKMPILFFTPDGSIPPKISKKVAQHTDIMPSILDYLNYNRPFFSFGQSVFVQDSNHFVVNTLDGNYILMDKDYCLVFNPVEDKPTELYELRKDILLKNNVIEQKLKVKQGLEKKLKAFIQQITKAYKENKTYGDF